MVGMRKAAGADQSGSGVEINAELGKFADFRELTPRPGRRVDF
jgi:hypothetical protein